MQLWVGLGNPGATYAKNRHNAGFLALDALAEAWHAPGWSKKFNALITEITISIMPNPIEPSKGKAPALGLARGGQRIKESGGGSDSDGGKAPLNKKILLLKPQQYMNRSGQAVGEALRFYKLEPAAVTVFHDELDLPLGKLRVKTGGGHGGHNGLRDIDAHIGKEYRRVRLGIDHPGDKDRVSDYVLSNFTGAEQKYFDEWMREMVIQTPLLAAADDAGFMNRMAAFS